jgi:tellurite resistance protein TerA
MYRLRNGDAGVIQPLGGNFGDRHASPWIFLDKDDRSGAAADGVRTAFDPRSRVFRPRLYPTPAVAAPDVPTVHR